MFAAIVLIALAIAYIGGRMVVDAYSRSLLAQLVPQQPNLNPSLNRSGFTHSGSRKIVLLGDSRIEKWDNLPILPAYEFINQGVGGESTAQILQRVGSDVFPLNPDVVVLQLGVNDLKAIGVLPDKKEWIIDSAKQNIKRILRDLNKHNVHVILMTILPAAKPDLLRNFVWSTDIDKAINELNQTILTLGTKMVTIINCTPIFSDKGKMRPELAADTLHINHRGYQQLNKLMERALVSISTTDQG